MAIKDYIPSVKTVGIVVVSAVVGAGAVFAAGVNGFFQEPFEPSKETCSKYFETRHGRFICLIAGQKEEGKVVEVQAPVKDVEDDVSSISS